MGLTWTALIEQYGQEAFTLSIYSTPFSTLSVEHSSCVVRLSKYFIDVLYFDYEYNVVLQIISIISILKYLKT